MISQLNHYQALGLAQTANVADIRAAFKSLALRFHPDKNTDKATATIIFKRIYSAYLTLSNEDTRNKYDMNLYLKTLRDNGTTPSGIREPDALKTPFFNLSAKDKEEFMRFKTFVNYAVFEEEVTDEQFAGMQPYLQNKTLKTALDIMKNELSQEIGLKKSVDSEDASSLSLLRRASMLKESMLNHASRKISKLPKSTINLSKKGNMRK